MGYLVDSCYLYLCVIEVPSDKGEDDEDFDEAHTAPAFVASVSHTCGEVLVDSCYLYLCVIEVPSDKGEDDEDFDEAHTAPAFVASVSHTCGVFS